MANKTINQALKDLFLGLGGNESALSDNQTVSDYIDDLESAIKASASGAAEDLINDETASETTVYSSSKVDDLIKNIPSGGGAEFPNVFKLGANNETFTFTYPEGYDRDSFFKFKDSHDGLAYKELTTCEIQYFTMTPMVTFNTKLTDVTSDITNHKVYYRGVIANATEQNKLYDCIVCIDGENSANDRIILNPLETTT